MVEPKDLRDILKDYEDIRLFVRKGQSGFEITFKEGTDVQKVYDRLTALLKEEEKGKEI